jgi:hypothetical protein
LQRLYWDICEDILTQILGELVRIALFVNDDLNDRTEFPGLAVPFSE